VRGGGVPHRIERESDRLQQLRAVLPSEVRVTSATHPLSGRLVAARSFKRLNGELLLVIELPGGGAGMPGFYFTGIADG
jgi:hypothetical protein